MAKKNVHFNDVVIGRKDNFFPVTENHGKEKVNFVLPKFNSTGMQLQAEKAAWYNNTGINIIHEAYKNYEPYRNLLVRFFLRPLEERIELEEDRFVINHHKIPGIDTVTVGATGASGNRYPDKEVDHSFNFDTKALVVNVPNFLKETFSVGDIITHNVINVKAPISNNHDFIVYDYNFTLESYKVVPNKNIESPHFGYALIPDSIVRGFIKNKK